jgi:hypothetical protein
MTGRPSKLTPELADRVALSVELGLSRQAAARSSGIDPRSLRRWIARGQRELDALSPEARLALRLGRLEQEARTLDWRRTAEILDELAAEPLDFGPS